MPKTLANPPPANPGRPQPAGVGRPSMPRTENKARQLNGQLYYAFTAENIAARRRCAQACHAFNTAGDATRRRRLELWRAIQGDTTPLPAQAATADEDDALLAHEPWIEPPVHADYGTNVAVGADAFVNVHCTILDTCAVRIGARSLLGSHVSLFAGTHPLDPEVRDGTRGPEGGGEVVIEEDVWVAGNVTILPGIRVGRGAVVGAGSVVTKDVLPYTVVAGNPAKKIKDVPRNTREEVSSGAKAALARDEAAGRA